jgi:uncharacterized protein YjiS (DUF1127 family)
MAAHAVHHAPAVVIFRAGTWLRLAARRIDAWLGARTRARADSLALEGMTDRELRDIGIDPARVQPLPWNRDWPL